MAAEIETILLFLSFFFCFFSFAIVVLRWHGVLFPVQVYALSFCKKQSCFETFALVNSPQPPSVRLLVQH